MNHPFSLDWELKQAKLELIRAQTAYIKTKHDQLRGFYSGEEVWNQTVPTQSGHLTTWLAGLHGEDEKRPSTTSTQ